MTLSTLVRRTLAGALVTVALSAPVHVAIAQKAHAASGDHDAQTLASYHLTEASLRKYYKAMGNMTKAVVKDPALQDTFENAVSGDDADIASIAAKYDKVPALKSAVTSAGFTTLEFATFSMSYMQASMAYGLMAQPNEKLRIKEVPKGTPKENVDFMRTHQELIQQLDKELKALQPQG